MVEFWSWLERVGSRSLLFFIDPRRLKFSWFGLIDSKPVTGSILSLSLSLSHLSVLLGNGRVWINSMVIIELIIRWRISSRMTFKRERERERDEKEMLAERLIQISRWTKQISTSSMLSTLLASMVDIWRRHIARSALFFSEREIERKGEREKGFDPLDLYLIWNVPFPTTTSQSVFVLVSP